MASSKRKGKKATVRKAASTSRFIVSDEKAPSVQLKPGMRLDVQVVKLLDPQLRPSRTIGARLCGGTSTCLALVDVGESMRPTSRRSGNK